MIQTPILKKLVLLSFLIISFLTVINGQSQKNSETSLYKEIAHMDSVLFNAYNSQDIATIKNVFDTSLEFYHDLGGVSNYQQNNEALQKILSANMGLRRELVAGSMEVYPVKDYGAIQTGSHTFCHLENGKPDCGTFKFVHIWQKKNGEWKLTRVVSYGH
jgi:Domain of unknown function (DUF4440)